jgi:RNA polymerase sigma-70 factor (ECF subfamily)
MPSARAKSKSLPSREVIDAIVSERARFQRFLTARTGSEAEAEDLLQQSLLKALQHDAQLRRGEKAVAWFYRILRNAISDHYRQKSSEQRRTDRLWTEMHAAGEDFAAPPKDWNRAVCACFTGLLPVLNPRYAKLIQRIDLNGESKKAVSRELKIKVGTLDVALHRARSSLRERLELFCGACSREKCLECFCVGEKT